MKQNIYMFLLLTIISFSNDNFNISSFEKDTLPILLKKDKQKIIDCEFMQDPCGEYIDKKYLKSEVPLLKYFLSKGGYVFPTKKEFVSISKKYFPNILLKPISRSTEKRDKLSPADWKGDNYYYDPLDSGVDIIVLREEKFITLAFSIGDFLDNKGNLRETKASDFLVVLNRYLFNNDHTQLKKLLKEHYKYLKVSHLTETIFQNLSTKDKELFLKLIKQQHKEDYSYWLKYFNYNLFHINNSKYKSLYSFCKSTGIKESEIRALNPWINKKATNIPPDAEIIVPKLHKEGKYEKHK